MAGCLAPTILFILPPGPFSHPYSNFCVQSIPFLPLADPITPAGPPRPQGFFCLFVCFQSLPLLSSLLSASQIFTLSVFFHLGFSMPHSPSTSVPSESGAFLPPPPPLLSWCSSLLQGLSFLRMTLICLGLSAGKAGWGQGASNGGWCWEDQRKGYPALGSQRDSRASHLPGLHASALGTAFVFPGLGD